ncbi:hypothetical protein CHLNCDRAFT_134746 [Chlorella variabilis]|uniref:Seipin n=1 Tax=Chlorella variabilis TaxID=554065 RepID=E1ZGP0_CHLVA|nr:hypothetical protein CHLNCDRAFT_134746 [Chlorella variabilis]EFN54789.1 hypothetical protein CHLNCDRAFT_134746 [Chlorella variabilis]|eukprot:XP_005846891.1 hypothetical protein CHLNCDRAFT_134746 [Chlorella variabilis]
MSSDGTVAPPSSSTSTHLLGSVWPAIQQWLAFFRGLTLAAGSAASCAVAAAGLALLLFLAVTLSFTPASDTFSRRLDMDFAAADLVAEAVFLPQPCPSCDGGATLRAIPRRFLAPQQGVDVWVELEVPQDTGQGVAQVVAQLTSLDGRPAAKASRALMLQSSSWRLRSLALAPLRWVGLGGDVRMVRLPLFTNYREKREVPFMVARLAIKTRNPAWAAEVVSATLKVQLRLGLIRRLLYTLRPSPLALLLLGGSALAAFLGGGAAALVFLGLLVYAGFGGGGEAAAVRDELSSNMSADVEVSSASDVSEASSSMLRELEDHGEPPSPRQHPGMPTSAAAGAQAALGPPSAAGTSATVAGAPRRKAGPADSAMGSDAGAAAGRSGLLRRRGRP